MSHSGDPTRLGGGERRPGGLTDPSSLGAEPSRLCPWGPTASVHSFAQCPVTLEAAWWLWGQLAEFRRPQSLRIPRGPRLLSLQGCGGRSSPDSFFAGGSWKVWLLELQATPSGAEAWLTLVLPWKGVQRRPPSLGSLASAPAPLRLTFSPRTEQQPAPLATRGPPPSNPIQDHFSFGGKEK